jgi:hypothetical protein
MPPEQRRQILLVHAATLTTPERVASPRCADAMLVPIKTLPVQI